MDKKYCIYLHRDLITNKCYVGQTCNKPEYRWNHGRGYIKNKEFYNDIVNHGWDDNFEHLILEENISESYVDERERFWIKQYDSFLNGYNKTEGGQSAHSFSDEVKKQISEVRNEYWNSDKGIKRRQLLSDQMKEFYKTEEGKLEAAKQSERMMGTNNPMYEKKHSNEAKKNISEKHKGELNPNYNKKGIKNHLSKPIFCYEENKIFGSLSEAKLFTDADPSSISKCCKGKAKTAGGKHWRYATELEILKLKEEEGL